VASRRTRNCNEGGCPRCNTNVPRGLDLEHCLCLHAEENALIEAGRYGGQAAHAADAGRDPPGAAPVCVGPRDRGRERAEGTTLYCNACPCLSCAKKIAQAGVRLVVYAEEYAMGHLTAALLSEAGIELRRLSHGPLASLAQAARPLVPAAAPSGEVSFDDSLPPAC